MVTLKSIALLFQLYFQTSISIPQKPEVSGHTNIHNDPNTTTPSPFPLHRRDPTDPFTYTSPDPYINTRITFHTYRLTTLTHPEIHQLITGAQNDLLTSIIDNAIDATSTLPTQKVGYELVPPARPLSIWLEKNEGSKEGLRYEDVHELLEAVRVYVGAWDQENWPRSAEVRLVAGEGARRGMGGFGVRRVWRGED